MKIAIGSDHAGFLLKQELINYLTTKNIQVVDKGCYSEERADYPDFGHAVAISVESKEVDLGILICGSGNGVAMTANKHQQIRAALVWSKEIGILSRQHNDANVLCLPARFITESDALTITQSFLTTEFEGGRHKNRVKKIALI